MPGLQSQHGVSEHRTVGLVCGFSCKVTGRGWVGSCSGYDGVGLPPCFSDLCSRKPLRRDDGTPLPGRPEWCRKRQPSGFKHTQASSLLTPSCTYSYVSA